MVEHAFENEIDDVKRLIEQGFYVDSVDARDNTPLSDAAAQGHSELVTYLLELGADPNSQSDLGRTPLWRAAFGGFQRCALYYLKVEPTLNHETATSSGPLIPRRTTRRAPCWTRGMKKETQRLLKKREKQMELALQERLKTAAQREGARARRAAKEVVGAATRAAWRNYKSCSTRLCRSPRRTASGRGARRILQETSAAARACIWPRSMGT